MESNDKETSLNFGGLPKITVLSNTFSDMGSSDPKHEERITEQLLTGKNLLIQTQYSTALTNPIMRAASKAGLSLVECNFFEKPLAEKSSNAENLIKAELDKLNGNAILIAAFINNRDAYIKVAKERNIPIVTLCYNENTPLELESFDSPELMMSKIDTLPLPTFKTHNSRVPTLSADVLSRMRINFASDHVEDQSNKPKPK